MCEDFLWCQRTWYGQKKAAGSMGALRSHPCSVSWRNDPTAAGRQVYISRKLSVVERREPTHIRGPVIGKICAMLAWIFPKIRWFTLTIHDIFCIVFNVSDYAMNHMNFFHNFLSNFIQMTDNLQIYSPCWQI